MVNRLTERWEFVVRWDTGRIESEKGPFYEYRDWPEELLPYKKTVTLTFSPTSESPHIGQD